jgi:hypothetical protein
MEDNIHTTGRLSHVGELLGTQVDNSLAVSLSATTFIQVIEHK